MTDVSRFTKYTSGEPVITVNVAAGLAFGLLVVITEQYLSVQWDELMLTIVGSLFLLGATVDRQEQGVQSADPRS